jgi:hypothetical protein
LNLRPSGYETYLVYPPSYAQSSPVAHSWRLIWTLVTIAVLIRTSAKCIPDGVCGIFVG